VRVEPLLSLSRKNARLLEHFAKAGRLECSAFSLTNSKYPEIGAVFRFDGKNLTNLMTAGTVADGGV
jgi:hypothetical protein